MNIHYEVIADSDIACLKDLCNELMVFQKAQAHIHTELFDDMCFETRLLPSVQGAKANYTVAVMDGEDIVGYVYNNIAPKETYNNSFANFFDLASVKAADVGCLSQFYLRDGYRGLGIGSVLYKMSMEWMLSFPLVEDFFVYVSNGNDSALKFYVSKGFNVSHTILDGFITVLRSSRK